MCVYIPTAAMYQNIGCKQDCNGVTVKWPSIPICFHTASEASSEETGGLLIQRAREGVVYNGPLPLRSAEWTVSGASSPPLAV